MNLTSLVTGDPYITRARGLFARNPCTILPNLYTCNPVTLFINYSSFHKQSPIQGGFCYRDKNASRNTRNKRFLDGKDLVKAPNGCSSHPHARGILVRRSE